MNFLSLVGVEFKKIKRSKILLILLVGNALVSFFAVLSITEW